VNQHNILGLLLSIRLSEYSHVGLARHHQHRNCHETGSVYLQKFHFHLLVKPTVAIAECISRTSTHLWCGETATFSKSRRSKSVEWLTHCAEPRESHRSDTDGRLLTEMNRSQYTAGAVAPDLQSLFPAAIFLSLTVECRSGQTKEFND
jgi:hypothetical protein